MNVLVALIAFPLVLTRLRESRGPDRKLDPLGLVLASTGVLAIVWVIVRTEVNGWDSTATLVPLIGGVVLLGAFLAWQHRATAPLLPLRLFRTRGFSMSNAVLVMCSFGTFGSVL